MPISQAFTLPYTPQMNTRSERLMQALKNHEWPARREHCVQEVLAHLHEAALGDDKAHTLPIVCSTLFREAEELPSGDHVHHDTPFLNRFR